MKTIKELNKLVKSGTPENIDLAIQSCKEQGLAFEDLEATKDWNELLDWLSMYMKELNITSFKEGVVLCTNIVKLNLSNVKITSIPKFIGKMKNLEYLCLSAQHRLVMSDTILQLKSLSLLILENFNVKSILPELSNLTNIKFLHLVGSGLTEFPKEINES